MGERDHLLCLFLPGQTHSKLIISEEWANIQEQMLLNLPFEEIYKETLFKKKPLQLPSEVKTVQQS